MIGYEKETKVERKLVEEVLRKKRRNESKDEINAIILKNVNKMNCSYFEFLLMVDCYEIIDNVGKEKKGKGSKSPKRILAGIKQELLEYGER